MSVVSFKMDEMDQTANIEPTMRRDQNDLKCALIKIVTNQQGFSFDVGLSGITEVEWQNENHAGEVWLYVSPGAKRITIQHKEFPKIENYDLGQSLKSGRTYILELTTDQVNQVVVDYNNSQILDVNVVPKTAEFYINGIRQKLDLNGHASISLPFGSHTYRVVEPSYHAVESRIVINDKENKQTLNIALKPAFGFLTVNAPAETAGAELYIDDRKVGDLPIGRMNLESGPHTLTVVHKLYHPYIEKISMKDSATVIVSPKLQPNYGEYDIMVDGDKEAVIYVDGDSIGTGRWSGRLGAGNHYLEARKESHKFTSQRLNTVSGEHRKVSLARPVPIYGTIEVHSQPTNVEVLIDGELLGKTDFINSRVLIGKRHVTMQLPGYKTEEFDIVVKEGQTERIDRTLTDVCDFNITSTPVANISIDGVAKGTTPYRMQATAGEYTIKISARGYSTYTKRMQCNAGTKDMEVKLGRNYINSSAMYVYGAYSPFGMSAAVVGVGTYQANFNMEVSCLIGLGKSEEIFWNDVTGATAPFSTTYTPEAVVGKVGYGIRLGSRLRLTPQLGAQWTKLKDNSKQEDTTASSDYSTSGNATSVSGGLRLSCALFGGVGVTASAEYLYCVKKSPLYGALSEVSPAIKRMTEGLHCSVGLTLGF